MKYEKEKKILIKAIPEAYKACFSFQEAAALDKAPFDVVTNIDMKIESYLINILSEYFPKDRILSEETLSDTEVIGRTWTIDPIDGTYNMAKGIEMFGVQCALYDEGELSFAIMYLPYRNEMYTAEKNGGSFKNDIPIHVDTVDLAHAVVSFGDFPHTRPEDVRDTHKIMMGISSKIARVRMFGAACVDYANLACGKTNGVVIFTKNKWDIAPGILICKEAGAIIRSLDGEYNENSRAVIAVATEELYTCIQESYLS